MATEARQQAHAERLTLLVAENKSGYFGVYLDKPGKPNPYKARVWRDGKEVHLGCFATAEEAALCAARSPEGRAAAAERAAAPAPLTSEEARQQALAEKLTLLVAENKTGYLGVYLNNPGKPKPYTAQVTRGGKTAYLGVFATAEEAALCVARSPEGRAAAAERAAAPAPLTSEEARQQAQAEKLTLLVAHSSSGYFGVQLAKPGKPKPYRAQVRRAGKTPVYLGMFATAEEAALCVARSPEGREAARRAAAAEGQGALIAVPSRASLKEEGTVPPMPPGAFVKEEGVLVPPMPPDAFVKLEVVVKKEEGPTFPAVPPGVSLKEEGTVPPMPPGTFVKEEGVLVPPMPPDAFVKVEVVVKEEEGSDSRPKRQRAK
jgi:hypothetical protein